MILELHVREHSNKVKKLELLAEQLAEQLVADFRVETRSIRSCV